MRQYLTGEEFERGFGLSLKEFTEKEIQEAFDAAHHVVLRSQIVELTKIILDNKQFAKEKNRGRTI